MAAFPVREPAAYIAAHALHYLRHRREIVLIPAAVYFIEPGSPWKRKSARRSSGPRIDRWKAAQKRAREVARLAARGDGG